MQVEQRFYDNLNIKPQDNSKNEPENSICSNIQASLNKIIAKEGYEKFDTKIKMVTTEGGNYLGDLYEVDVKGHTKNGFKEINIFVKIMPKEHFFTRAISISQSYYNERLAYEEIGKIMNELYIEARVPESDRFKMVKYYTESNKHALFFENLNRKGYNTLDRRQVISLNYAKSAIKELAKFHSISFILKSKRNDYFEKNIKTIKCPVFFDRNDVTSSDWWEEFYTKSINTSFEYINKEFVNKKEETARLRDMLYDMASTDSSSRFSSVNCMCHGDVKPGNILWRQNDEGEIETVFIDYQLLNYGTPIYDILFFIYLGTDGKFRKQHLNYLKNLYHDTMADFLKYFDLDVNSFYPKHVFEKDFQERLHYGLILGLLFVPFLLNENPNTSESNGSDQVITLHPSFKERINEIFQDFVDWGIL